MGIWMRYDNAKRNQEQGLALRAGDVDTDMLENREKSPEWRYFT